MQPKKSLPRGGGCGGAIATAPGAGTKGIGRSLGGQSAVGDQASDRQHLSSGVSGARGTDGRGAKATGPAMEPRGLAGASASQQYPSGTATAPHSNKPLPMSFVRGGDPKGRAAQILPPYEGGVLPRIGQANVRRSSLECQPRDMIMPNNLLSLGLA